MWPSVRELVKNDQRNTAVYTRSSAVADKTAQCYVVEKK